MQTILRPEWLLDGSGADALGGYAVVIEDDVIAAVGPAAEYPSTADSQTVDLPRMTLIPGLCNNHVHLVLPGDSAAVDPSEDNLSEAQLTIRAVHNMGMALRAGITTVRDCGGRGRIVVDVRDARAEGLIEGARVISCAYPLTITGGHTRQFGGEADGDIALRRMVRSVASQGVDFVKVMASGGGTSGTYPQYPSFTVDELRVIAETSHGLGLKVSAHCTNAAATLNCIEAGIDMIEHAMFFNEDLMSSFERHVAERLADAQIPVTPTLQVDRDMLQMAPSEEERAVWRERNRVHREGVAAMIELGVPVIAGSDAGWRITSFDTFWCELAELVACGMSPAKAIHAASGAIYPIFPAQKPWGTVSPDHVADVTIVEGNLAENIENLRNVRAVFQSGRLARSSLANLTAASLSQSRTNA